MNTRTSVDLSRRVVVTGLGVISSIGIGWQDFWKNLIAGKSGISKVTSFDTSSYDRHYGGEAKNFDPTKFLSKQKIKYYGRASQMAIAATKLAIKDSCLKFDHLIRDKTAVCVGTTTGEIKLLEDYWENRLKNKPVLNSAFANVYPASSIATNVAYEFKLKKFTGVFATACASGNYALGYGYDLIRLGKADYVLAGGADAMSRVVFTGFGRLFAIAPEKCQPFDKNRQGMIPGEGAGMIVLESLESAIKRKAHIYAEVLGYGMSCDATHMTEPNAQGISKSISKAIKSSGATAGQIDYICAHGTGTKENDRTESQAVSRVFQKNATTVPMTSIKSMLGHTMGAASILESIACCLAIETNKIPPTINLLEKDPQCQVNCEPKLKNNYKVKNVLNNSQAFGGNNATVFLSNLK